MATRRWVGRARPIPQVTPLTPGSVSVGSTFTVTINRKAVTYTATAATVANAVAGIADACASMTEPEFAELSFEDSTTVVTVTGPADGRPFTLTLSAGGTGSPTFTQTTTTSPSGPNWFNVAANWSENSVPASTDDVFFDGGPSCLYGLDNNTITLASLTVTPNFPEGSEIGLPRTNGTNANGYPEYRDQRLRIGATVCQIDTASRRIRLDLDTDQTALTVFNTGSPNEGDVAALDVIGTNSSSTANILKGSVAIAGLAGETAQFASVRVAVRTQREGDANVLLGSGLTVATVEQTGGAVDLRCAVTTYTKENGSANRQGTGAIATLNNRGGAFNDFGTGTITTLNQSGEYVRGGLAGLTVTNTNLYGGGATTDEAGVVTWTNAVQFVECSPAGAAGDTDRPASAVHAFNFGRHRKITVADI